ncbi:hypothetical protein M409DRAFT_54526 [Zasmidium cellare ATCC 36951]|uniref:Essential protein Yae1 N-terminal domain-containing protein n=1 Tax=Zasmidium cellare ATCC 36951 TaxID=1080233 RepID=A0A6A6CHX3_ZASCE|nr:uncharacterized protein M409DRAFT_54526 [Zasmidium cellare ATCC 36951]KAF2166735.1 hypothetical protein M409DRAFT_54526 [Zasmidium cellare ATCC 36951]
MAADDVFEDVLNLEEQYYREGFELGVADGSKSGRIEGRIFGLEKGFEKFLEMGRLNGKAFVWEARLPDHSAGSESTTTAASEVQLPALSGTERLKKHVDRLAALSDPDGLSTENSEDAVSEFDDRLKDAKAKATLISRIIGENEVDAGQQGGSRPSAGRGRVVRVRRNDSNAAPRNTGEMEDFVGLRGSRS